VRTNPAQAAVVAACLRQGAANAQSGSNPDGSAAARGVVFETNQGNLSTPRWIRSSRKIERGLCTDHIRRQV